MNPKTIFALALAFRLAVLLLSRPWSDDWPQRLTYSGDPFEYSVLGKSLLTRGVLSVTWPNAMPDALRLPVYPAFVGLTSGGGQISLLWCTVLVQVLIDSFFASLLVRMTGALFNHEALGGAVGLIYALNPDAALYASQLFAESISVWLLVGTIYGVAAAAQPAAPGAWKRFAVGVLCGAMLVLCKPIWQYVWMAVLGWLALMAWRARARRSIVAFLAAGWLCMAAPGVLWVKRNYDTWGVASLSFSKAYTERTIAEGVITSAGATGRVPIPDFSREMQLHCIMPDFSQPDFMPPAFQQVTSWDRSGVAGDYRVAHELYATTLRDFRPAYVKLHFLSTAYTIFSPATNFATRFFGTGRVEDSAFANFGTSGLTTTGKFFAFLQRALSNPVAIVWSVLVVSYLVAYYAAILFGARTYLTHYRWNIWTLFLLGGGSLLFLLGPSGSSRYRFALIQAFLPLAALGYLRWRSRGGSSAARKS